MGQIRILAAKDRYDTVILILVRQRIGSHQNTGNFGRCRLMPPPRLLGGSFRALFVASLVGIVVAVQASPGTVAVPAGQTEHSVRGAPKHGSAYSGREQYEDDAEANRQRLRHDPNDEEALRALGFDYGELGEFADALAIESRAV